MRNLLLLVSVLLSALLAAHPAAAAESVRIAVLTSQDTTPYQEVLSGFQQHLDQRGLQVVYDISSLQGNMAKAETALARLKHDGAELLFTLGTLATQAAVRENVDTPLLASLILNTEDLKQAKNATAVTLEFPVDLQLQWLRRILPQQQAVGVLFNPRDNADTIRAAQRVAPSVGLTLLARVELESLDFELRPLVEEIAELFAKRAHKKGVELLLQIGDEVPTTLYGDPHRLRQILTNLIGNAIKFTEKGEVVVEVKSQKSKVKN